MADISQDIYVVLPESTWSVRNISRYKRNKQALDLLINLDGMGPVREALLAAYLGPWATDTPHGTAPLSAGCICGLYEPVGCGDLSIARRPCPRRITVGGLPSSSCKAHTPSQSLPVPLRLVATSWAGVFLDRRSPNPNPKSVMVSAYVPRRIPSNQNAGFSLV